MAEHKSTHHGSIEVGARSATSRITSENGSVSETLKSEQGPVVDFPEGGSRAWAVVAGGSGIMFCTFGYINTWGVYQAYYVSHQLINNGPSAVSWIGSVQTFLLFGSGLIAGPLFDRVGTKVLYFPSFTYVVSVMMTSLCKEFWQFLLAQGILAGLSAGFMVSAAMSVIGQYFNQKRGAAMGLVIAGSSLGGVLIPIALGKMLETSLGFAWSVRVLGFIFLAILIPSVAAIRTRLPSRNTKFFITTAFTESYFLVLVAASFFCVLGGFVPIFYLPTYAISRGMSPTLASYLAAIFNAASVPGRILPGVLSDKLGRLNVLATAALASAVMIFCWPYAKTNASIIVFGAFFGFVSGAIISGVTVSLSSATKIPQNIGAYMGQGMAFASIAALISPPINGALLNHYHAFDQLSYFTGACTLLGAFGAFAVKFTTPEGILGKI